MDAAHSRRAVSAFEVDLTVEGLFADTNLRKCISAVSRQNSRFDVISKVSRQHRVLQIRLQIRIENGHNYFDATIEIARHPVGRSDVEFFIAAVAEIENAAMFEKSTHDTSHVNGLRKSG